MGYFRNFGRVRRLKKKYISGKKVAIFVISDYYIDIVFINFTKRRNNHE